LENVFAQIYRVVGLRPILIGSAVYTGFYLWERMRWNAAAKEHQFKQQLRLHVQLKLRYLQHAITSHCDEQVRR
jgi:hypothetical protein